MFLRSAVSESGETLRKSEIETSTEAVETSPEVVETSPTLPDVKAEDYGKGVIFYMRENVVVGVLMWNVFNKISLARKIIREHRRYDDLAEVAKLFRIHEKLEGDPEN